MEKLTQQFKTNVKGQNLSILCEGELIKYHSARNQSFCKEDCSIKYIIMLTTRTKHTTSRNDFFLIWFFGEPIIDFVLENTGSYRRHWRIGRGLWILQPHPL